LLPDQNCLATASRARKVVEIWEPKTGRLVRTIANQCYVHAATSGYLATTDDQNQFRLWRTSEEPVSTRLHRPWLAGRVVAAGFSPDGNQLASSDPRGFVYLHSIARPDPFATFRVNNLPILRLLFSLDGRTLFGASQDQRIFLWDVPTKKLLGTLRGHTFAVHALALSRDGGTLASGSGDGTVRLWDWRRQAEVGKLAGHRAGVFDVAFTADGRTLASASEDRTAVLWHLPTLRETVTLRCDSGVAQVLFRSFGDLMITREITGRVRVWPAPFAEP
jgi:WD40 repeat protein